MKLNEKDLISYSESGDEVTFVLDGVTLDEALAIDGSSLVITSQDKEYKRFEGYTVMSVGYQDMTSGYVSARFARKLDESTEQAIKALETNVSTVRSDMDAVVDDVSYAKQTSETNKESVEKLEQGQAEMKTSLDILLGESISVIPE